MSDRNNDGDRPSVVGIFRACGAFVTTGLEHIKCFVESRRRGHDVVRFFAFYVPAVVIATQCVVSYLKSLSTCGLLTCGAANEPVDFTDGEPTCSTEEEVMEAPVTETPEPPPIPMNIVPPVEPALTTSPPPKQAKERHKKPSPAKPETIPPITLPTSSAATDALEDAWPLDHTRPIYATVPIQPTHILGDK